MACQNCGMGHAPDDAAACIEGHGDDPISAAPAPAYLLSTFRADLSGGWHDHLGVWATLEDAQAYSTQIGGVGEWDTVEYDSIEYWSRGTADPALRHKIEGIAYMGDGAVVD